MEPKGPEWLGLELIQASGMKPKAVKAYSHGWCRWVSWCAELEVPALAATGDDAVGWLRHEERKAWVVKETKKAVSLVYRALGMASPFQERRAMREVFGGNGRYGAEEGVQRFCQGVPRSPGARLLGVVPRGGVGLPCPGAVGRWRSSCWLWPRITRIRWSSRRARACPGTWRTMSVLARAVTPRCRRQ